MTVTESPVVQEETPQAAPQPMDIGALIAQLTGADSVVVLIGKSGICNMVTHGASFEAVEGLAVAAIKINAQQQAAFIAQAAAANASNAQAALLV